MARPHSMIEDEIDAFAWWLSEGNSCADAAKKLGRDAKWAKNALRVIQRRLGWQAA